MLYVASPYTHAQPHVRRARAYCTTVLLGELMARLPHDWFFSPITQGHAVAQHLSPGAQGLTPAAQHEFWMRQCRCALREAQRLYLLPIPGWQQSKGVQEELTYCHNAGLPVVYVNCGAWAHHYLLHSLAEANFRSNTEQEAKRIWELLATAWAVKPQVEGWRKNWEVVELGEMEAPLEPGVREKPWRQWAQEL